jgi:NADH-quinone oxidoreductase subunit F
MPLTFEDARAAGATLGSGVVMLFDETADMMAVLQRIARFFQDESCGQCVPCRVGTVRQTEALQRRDFALLDEIGAVMRDASICGLGQTAANAIASAKMNLKLW